MNNLQLFSAVLIGNLFATVVLPFLVGYAKGERFTRRSSRALKLATFTAFKTSPFTTIFTKHFMLPIVESASQRKHVDAVEIIAKYFLLLAIGDTVYYFLHRVFHHPLLYKYHAEHHSFTPQFTLATSAVGLADAMVTVVFGMVMVPFLVVPNPPFLTIVAYIATLVIQGNHIHSGEHGGVDIAPFTNPGEHAVHHRFGGPNSFNFGGLTTIWDRLLGTYKRAGFKRSNSSSSEWDENTAATTTKGSAGRRGPSSPLRLRFVFGGIVAVSIIMAPRRPEQIVRGKIVLDGEALSTPQAPLAIQVFDYVTDHFKEWLVPITEESLLALAKKRSGGLESFVGDDPSIFGVEDGTYWRTGLRLLMEDINDKNQSHRDEMTTFGRVMLREQLVGALVAQLQVVDVLRTDPGILERDLGEIAILAGLPRTGSTALHQMLCQHPDTRCLKFFETILPVSDQVPIPPPENDRRVSVAKVATAVQNWLRPWLTAMFPLFAQVPFEELFLTSHVMSSWQLVFGFAGERYSRWYIETDHTPAYRYVKAVYQLMDHQARRDIRQGTVRIMKSPQHMVNFDAIQNVFPEAMMVMTSRDMVPVVESLATILSYGIGTSRKHVNLQRFGKKLISILSKGLDRAVSSAGRGSFFTSSVRFESFAENSTQVALEVIGQIGLKPVDGETLTKGLPPRQGATRLSYHIEDFGLDASRIRNELNWKKDVLQEL